jgi:radical SAM family uncharacterized protein/radical SAM-linked protein
MKRLLPILPRPSRLLGSEWGVVRKDPASVRLRLALAFPDLYEVGMSYLGQKILLDAVNARPEYWAERVYAPCQDTAALLREHGEPLCTLESDTPLRSLDLVGFSLTHELCFSTVLYLLDLAGLPLRAAERDASMPLILAGGGASFNLEPVAEFFDAAVLGDGEEALLEVLDACARAKDEGLSRPELLRRLAGIRGVYVPSFFRYEGPGRALTPLVPGCEAVDRAVVADLDAAPFPTLTPVAFGQAVHDRLTLEIGRGCSRGCRFCQAGMLYRPVRERSLPALNRLLREGVEATGHEEVSFLSLSTGDFSALEGLFDLTFSYCRSGQTAISLPSLRVGSLSSGIMRQIASIRRTGATIAPEAGSQRLRDVINKGVTEEGLLDHTRRLFENGWQQVKLYFMIGLPTETEEDLRAIADLCLKVRATAPRSLRRLQITASVSPFVPKPHTPFQWERQIGLAEIRERVGFLIRLFKPLKAISLKYHTPEMSYLEGVFSRGDRRLAPVLEAAFRAGAVFSGWRDMLKLEPYLAALEQAGLTPEEYLAARDPAAPLPWDHLRCGVGREYLLKERDKALAGELTPDCRFASCTDCGACPPGPRTPVASAGADAGTKPATPRIRLADPEAARAKGRIESGQDLPDPDAADPNAAAQDAPGQAVPEQTGASQDGVPQAAAGQEARQPGQPPRPPRPHNPEMNVRAAHVRLWYEKTGPAAYLSQLELQSLFERALRRADAPVTFSAGFHPLPEISFGRALSVGASSRCEWLNLFLRRDVPPESLLAALAPAMPEGLTLKAVEPIGMGKKQPQAMLEVYELAFAPGDGRNAARIEVLGQAAEAQAWPATIRTKSGENQMDLAPAVQSAEPLGPDAVRLTLSWRTTYISPLKIVNALLPGLSPLDFTLTKVSQRFGE